MVNAKESIDLKEGPKLSYQEISVKAGKEYDKLFLT